MLNNFLMRARFRAVPVHRCVMVSGGCGRSATGGGLPQGPETISMPGRRTVAEASAAGVRRRLSSGGPPGLREVPAGRQSVMSRVAVPGWKWPRRSCVRPAAAEKFRQDVGMARSRPAPTGVCILGMGVRKRWGLTVAGRSRVRSPLTAVGISDAVFLRTPGSCACACSKIPPAARRTWRSRCSPGRYAYPGLRPPKIPR